EAAATPGALRVFERVAAAPRDADAVWLTMLPGFPDGSYGWAQVDRMLGDGLRPRLYAEPVGQGDSDKPRDYPYSTVERADLVQALWRHHRVRATVVVTFDYTSLALLELLRRQLDRAMTAPVITAAVMINGGLFADAQTHPWQGTPLLRSPVGALGVRGWQRSPRAFAASMLRARMFSPGYRPAPAELTELWSAVTPPDRAPVAPNAPGFVRARRAHAPQGAAEGPGRHAPAPGGHGAPLGRRHRAGRIRPREGPRPPPACAPGHDPDLPRRPPDHRRAPRPARRGDPRHRRTAR